MNRLALVHLGFRISQAFGLGSISSLRIWDKAPMFPKVVFSISFGLLLQLQDVTQTVNT
jgi:hypothetical protein